jgi:hypothetical protein
MNGGATRPIRRKQSSRGRRVNGLDEQEPSNVGGQAGESATLLARTFST